MTEIHTTKWGAMLGTIQVISAGICWGTLGIFSTYLGNLGLTGLQISILRIITAGVLVLVMLPHLLPKLKQLNARQWSNLALQSLIGVLGMTVCYFIAVLYIGAGMAVALLYTAPVFSLVLAHFLLHEKVTKVSATLAFMAVIGVGLTMVGDGDVVLFGVVMGLLSGMCYSLFGILGKKAMKDAHSPLLLFFTSVTISAVALLFYPDTYSTYQTLFGMSMKTWLYVLGLSVVGTIAPFLLYMSALNKLPATKASVFTIFEPLTAVLLSVMLLNQSMGVWQIIGVCLILLATVLNALLGMKMKATRRPSSFHDETDVVILDE